MLPYRKFPAFSLAAFVLACLLFAACGTTNKTRKAKESEPSYKDKEQPASSAKLDNDVVAILDANESSLDDVFATQKSDIPPAFLKKSTRASIGDPYQGYRIQIISTRDVTQADSIANDFRFWAEDALAGYIPKTYVFFRQPFYKVHIGNFQFQDEALKLNRLLKARYPGAWIVHDEIEPNLVPSDTTQIKLRH